MKLLFPLTIASSGILRYNAINLIGRQRAIWCTNELLVFDMIVKSCKEWRIHFTVSSLLCYFVFAQSVKFHRFSFFAKVMFRAVLQFWKYRSFRSFTSVLFRTLISFEVNEVIESFSCKFLISVFLYNFWPPETFFFYFF